MKHEVNYQMLSTRNCQQKCTDYFILIFMQVFFWSLQAHIKITLQKIAVMM